MGIFNHNIKYIRDQVLRLTLADFAAQLDEPEGKLLPYEREGNPKQEFYKKLHERFGIDLNVLLTKELTRKNEREALYDSKKSDLITMQSKGMLEQIDLILQEENADRRAGKLYELRDSIITELEEKETLKTELLDMYRKFTRTLKQMEASLNEE